MPPEDLFDTFVRLVEDQFKYGGVKYGDPNSTTRETTDSLFENHGKNWLFGTIDKYTYRFKNLKRERDLLKIATYMYILWLKRGFFVQESGVDSPPINTTVRVKSEHFGSFLRLVKKEKGQSHWSFQLKPKQNVVEQWELDLDVISNKLVAFSNKVWKEIDEDTIVQIFLRAYRVWEFHFSEKAGQDTDTWVGEKNKSK